MKTLLLSILLITTCFSFSQEEESTIDTCYLDIPRVVEPSDDHPYLETKSNCEIDTFKIMVFNRWGEILFETNDIQDHWKANDAQQGVYVWKIFIRFLTGKEWEGNGHFTIIH